MQLQTCSISGLRLRLPGWQRWQAPRLLQGSSTLHLWFKTLRGWWWYPSMYFPMSAAVAVSLAQPVRQCCHFTFVSLSSQNPLVLGHANSTHPAAHCPICHPAASFRGAGRSSVAAWRGAASVDARAPAPLGGRTRRRNGEARETWDQRGSEGIRVDFGHGKSGQTWKKFVYIVIWQTHTHTDTHTNTHAHAPICITYICMCVCVYIYLCVCVTIVQQITNKNILGKDLKISWVLLGIVCTPTVSCW